MEEDEVQTEICRSRVLHRHHDHIASTAGCTSSSTSSNQQASQPASGDQAASGYPPDKSGSDPNPSVMPRYNPSQRSGYVDYPDHGSTSYTYDTKDTLRQVSSFYQTQMPKLGYTVKVIEDRPDYSLIKYQKNGKTVVRMMLMPVSDTSSQSSSYLTGNYTSIAVGVNGPNSDYSTVIGD